MSSGSIYAKRFKGKKNHFCGRTGINKNKTTEKNSSYFIEQKLDVFGAILSDADFNDTRGIAFNLISHCGEQFQGERSHWCGRHRSSRISLIDTSESTEQCETTLSIIRVSLEQH